MSPKAGHCGKGLAAVGHERHHVSQKAPSKRQEVSKNSGHSSSCCSPTYSRQFEPWSIGQRRRCEFPWRRLLRFPGGGASAILHFYAKLFSLASSCEPRSYRTRSAVWPACRSGSGATCGRTRRCLNRRLEGRALEDSRDRGVNDSGPAPFLPI